MKKNIIISILTLIIVIQFFVLININHNKDASILTDLDTNVSQNKNVNISNTNTIEIDKNLNFTYSHFMDNPIDHYFSAKLKSKTEAEVRDSSEEYEAVWEEEYYKVINIINNKCIYNEDKKNLNIFKENVENLIAAATPVLEMEMLDSYKLTPDSPEKHSWGNSTYSYLQSIKGQIYRDASMLIIPYLSEEYEFPNMNDN